MIWLRYQLGTLRLARPVYEPYDVEASAGTCLCLYRTWIQLVQASSRGRKIVVSFNPRVKIGLIPDFGRTRPPDYCLIICKVDLWYKFRLNGDFISGTLRSSIKTRLEP